jgi:hypothetical protein
MLATGMAAFCAYCHKMAQFLEKPATGHPRPGFAYTACQSREN